MPSVPTQIASLRLSSLQVVHLTQPHLLPLPPKISQILLSPRPLLLTRQPRLVFYVLRGILLDDDRSLVIMHLVGLVGEKGALADIALFLLVEVIKVVATLLEIDFLVLEFIELGAVFVVLYFFLVLVVTFCLLDEHLDGVDVVVVSCFVVTAFEID